MIHSMKLNQRPFELMARGVKSIELRLNDEKRQKIVVGDTINFYNVENENERITAKVIKLHYYRSFVELYADLPLDKIGYSSDELSAASPKDMEKYYSAERQDKYGVLAIEVELING
ncbi:MAG: ASCH domain-containing protein [Clostridia bacterium]|nr:ASCH domain-containing protein [Clostridia bacterium]